MPASSIAGGGRPKPIIGCGHSFTVPAMSAEHTAIIRGNREFAHRLVDCAPQGSVVTVKPSRRSLDQNALLWAILSRISAAKPEGRQLTPEVWKSVFMHALGHEQRFEMALDGKGFVPVGFRTSRMNKEQFSELIEFVRAYAATHGIDLDEPNPKEVRAA